MTTPDRPATVKTSSAESAPAPAAVGQLSREQWTEVSALFETLLDAPDLAVEEQINSSNLDPGAQALLRQMLAANGSQSILDQSIDDLAERLLDLHSPDSNSIPDDLIGRTFGHWLVTRELARGGMGAVFEARRIDGQFEKTVALKVIKPGAYSEHTAQRFADEMRTLARLEHPSIARLVDGGLSGDGIPYFAMEYVEGKAISEYADHHRLSIRARVDLVIQVCAAVEHAHRNLIVHGDLKPSNILVNSSGQVRLLDFGIAQSLQPGDGKMILPRYTPDYAAPEQVGGQRLTTSCDVFGLTAVLFELCCGSAPRAGQKAGNAEELRALLDEPIASARQRLVAAPDQSAIAQRRKTTFRALRRLLGGDLDWILHKGLTIDPNARLPNVAELRAELDRWQRGLAVESHPPRAGYRLRRWVGRHRVSVSITAVALCGLLLAGASVLRQTQIATSESAKARWSSEFLLSIFRHADPLLNQQQPITVNALTDDAAEKLLNNRETIAPELQIEAASVLGEVQSNLGQYESAAELSRLQLSLAEQVGDRRAIVAASMAHAEALAALDRLQPAIDLFRRALKLAPLDATVDPMSVSATQQLAMLLARISEYDEARVLSDDLLRHENRIAASPDGANVLSMAYSTRSTIERDLEQTDQAMRSIETALTYARQVGEDSRTYVDVLTNLAALHYSTGNARATAEVDQQVVALFDQLYGSDHPLTLEARSELAVSLSQLGEMGRALKLEEQVLAGYRNSLGEENQYVAGTLANMGASERALGQFQKSLEHYEASLALWRRLDTAPPTSVASVLLGHGRILIELQRYREAEQSFVEAMALIEQTLGSDHILYSRAQAYFAPVLMETGRIGEAAALLDPAYERLVETYGSDSVRTSIAAVTLAQLRQAEGDKVAANSLALGAISVLDAEGTRQRHAIELAKARQIADQTSTQ